MVFRSIFEPQFLPQITDSYSPMASSSTLKHHKPLHNFHLPPDLKWSVNHTNTSTHRFRKPAACSQKLMHILSNSDSDVSPVGGGGGGSKTRAGAGDSPSPPNRKGEKLGFPISDSPVTKKSKICIRIKTKQIKCLQEVDEAANAGDQHQNQVQNQNQDHGVEYDDAEDSLAKTWNLRPRRGVGKGSGGNGGVPKIVAVVPEETNEAASDANKCENEEEKEEKEEENQKKKKQKKKKKKTKLPKLSIPLTKLEIEEDIYALTGSKPSRKPKKRSKHVQRQLDYLFPGMWLSSITPDMYRVNDTPTKD